ncbi:MAG: GatB/YqeY domain-containing protein [Candidatus Nealsonbacteria bacterium]|nr:GatB/YqeY domain-containing protein [Candidatus Nealsonbacteria bacterium]
MSLKEKIHQDLNEALKSKEELKTSVLRLLSSSILNKEKDKRYKSGKAEDISLTDEEITDVISSESKKRKEAIELYQKGGRPELAKKEKEEMEILQKYLPDQLSEEEIRKLVKAAIVKTSAKDQKDMGKVMAELMSKTKGKADGSLVSKIVKESLS